MISFDYGTLRQKGIAALMLEMSKPVLRGSSDPGSSPNPSPQPSAIPVEQAADKCRSSRSADWPSLSNAVKARNEP